MFFIPGPVIALLTFPGVIVHETGHFFFCRLFRLAVFDVCFFRFGNPAGYVIHERTDNFKALFFVSMGPFFVNTLLCMVFCTAAFSARLGIEDARSSGLLLLLARPVHRDACFPFQGGSLKHLGTGPGQGETRNVLAALSLPLIASLYVLNYARLFWADLGYGIAVGILGPIALFRALA